MSSNPVEALDKDEGMAAVKKVMSIAVGIAVLASIGVAPSSARPKRTERTVEIAYAGPGSGVQVAGTRAGGLCPLDVHNPQQICVAAPVEPGERYVSVEFADLSGQKVSGYLSQDINAYEFKDFGEFCGETKRPAKLPFPQVAYVQLWYYEGTCADGTPSVVTTGKITLTFSNRP